jgi:hypothetical protein
MGRLTPAGSSKPVPKVRATATPKISGATTAATAVMISARRREVARAATTGATTLALSVTPSR